MTGITMSQEDLDRLANEVLTLMELDETRLLSWGFVRVLSDLGTELPGMLDRLPAVGRALWERGQVCGVTPAIILANLLERRLVFESQGRYRSRFAEAVRLLFWLRQRFGWEDWQTGPRLVSDLRLQLQRRRYPRRDVPPAEVMCTLAMLCGDLEREATQQLLRGADGTPFNLARFQLDAITQLLHDLRGRADHAVVVGAGTGAGKTKAFYIPALAHIAAAVSPEPWVKALAIYPRVELLKDQLAEAYSETRKLDTLLRERGLPALTIGAYYADTPRSAQQLRESQRRYGPRWELTRAGDGWIFPAMTCLDCQGSLVWSKEDVQAEERENRRGIYGLFARLRCGSCARQVGSDQIILTREQMVRHPPDILFTTTEMLNRRLSRVGEHALFGVGVARAPRLLLLDEVHTYEGLNGAHVAHLLRRWRHARARNAQESLIIVGLSATLTQAEQFFARLTGLPPSQVSYVTPRQEDIVEEGVEYNLVLKGDPVSGTSLLSTSVQTAMLMARILDAPSARTGGNISRGTYGQKIFAFTDTLDVINRWFHIEQDAETNQVLSQYRGRPPRAGSDEVRRRNDGGQYWWACRDIGHDLEAPLLLDLTSSQYRGVRSDAALIVATSTLEVGFNDPDVGAVIQHKAPRGAASLLQRKGRAGRTRAMRPWMVVVTSAYGRDRWAFQHAERIFSPTLPPIELPVENIYVRKIQAGYALMDWLSVTLRRRGADVDGWAMLSSADRGGRSALRGQRHAAAALLEGVLNGGEIFDDLCTHLRDALALQHDEAALHLILWGEPRPLLMEVIPTVLRQIESDWQRVEGGAAIPWGDSVSAHPLPHFVPPNLFSLLSLPELALHIPEEDAPGAPMREDEYMSLAQGMSEFAPGHVSKRYARSHLLKEAHWLALPDDEHIADGNVQLGDLAVAREPVPLLAMLDGREVRVYRPRAYTLSLVPPGVRPTSSARLLWRSSFVPQQRGVASNEAAGQAVLLTPDSPWRNVFADLRVFTHAANTWVEVTRMALGVRAETRYGDGTERRRRLRFAEGETTAALGFSISADALCAHFTPLDAGAVLGSSAWPILRQHLLPAYTHHLLAADSRVQSLELSDFEIGWLWQLEHSMLVAVAVAQQVDLATAADEVRRRRAALAERTMDAIFQVQRFEEEEDDIGRTGRLRQRLMELIADEAVAAALADCVTPLWSAPDAALTDWLGACYAASLGSALFDAVTRVAPDINPDDLVMDVEGDMIWICEQTPGGVGIVGRIANAIARRPHDLDLQLRDTVRHCDRETLASQLAAVAEHVAAGDPGIISAFAAARASTDVRAQREMLQQLARALEAHALPTTRDLVVALSTRFLRPSSDTDSDALVATLARRWGEEQRRLGCAIDVRVMAVAARRLEEIDGLVETVLRRVGGVTERVDESQVFNLLQSLLWLDCRDSCPDCIERGHPYQRLAKPSRALLRLMVDVPDAPVVYGVEGWDGLVVARLAESYTCRIRCDQGQITSAQSALTHMLVTPVEIGFQQHYPIVERIERSGGGWEIELVIRELVQR